MDHIVRALEDSELTEAEFNGFGEAELELTDTQLELIYGGCGGSCPISSPSDDDGGWF